MFTKNYFKTKGPLHSYTKCTFNGLQLQHIFFFFFNCRERNNIFQGIMKLRSNLTFLSEKLQLPCITKKLLGNLWSSMKTSNVTFVWYLHVIIMIYGVLYGYSGQWFNIFYGCKCNLFFWRFFYRSNGKKHDIITD
jgi:hypothetical protein